MFEVYWKVSVSFRDNNSSYGHFKEATSYVKNTIRRLKSHLNVDIKIITFHCNSSFIEKDDKSFK